MFRFMGEQVAQAASRLVPFLALLLGVFGVLIVAALILRAKVRAESWARQKERSRWQPQLGEPCLVLGRAFTVVGLQNLADCSRLVSLQGEQAAGRLLLPPQGESLFYFPGTLTMDGLEGIPAEIVREGETFRRMIGPLEISAGHQLAAYESGGRLLLLERIQNSLTVWRGKAIPREGFAPLEK
jgi:hypothetical protein